MSIDQQIAARFLTGSDLWSPVRSRPNPSPGYRFPARRYGSAIADPRRPRCAPRILISNLLKSGDVKQATNAARPLSVFIESQQEKLAKRASRPRRRPLSAPPVDTRLWLDERGYAAWTICGQLVSIKDPQPGKGSPKVRLAEREETRQLLAVNRLIPTVIALYRGDSIGQGVVTRYMPHHDLEKAHLAALERSQAIEEAITLEHTETIEQQARPAPKIGFKPLKKSRFHPLGNFIIYQEPSPEDDLPPFAIKLLGFPVPDAFETKRKAQRYIDKHARRGNLPQSCKIARMLARALVSPVMRKGFKRPRDPAKFLEMIQKDSRVVEPELHVEWLPRYKQDDDGEWRLEVKKNRGTVRHGVRHKLKEDLVNEADRMCREYEDQDVRHKLGQPYEQVMRGEEATAIALRCERILSKSEKVSLAISDWTLGPEWPDLQRRAGETPSFDEGHWLRAPFETGKPHTDGLRSRIIELRIDDLPGLLEQFGMEPKFWLVKESPAAAPRWVASCPFSTLLNLNGSAA